MATGARVMAKSKNKSDPSKREKIVKSLNKILQHELTGVICYTHYSFRVFGYSRIPVTGWFRDAATEGLLHANEAGEMITFLGEEPEIHTGKLPDTSPHDMGDILRECLAFETKGIELYQELLTLAEGHSLVLEEFARQKVAAEAIHLGEIDKMLRPPGTTQRASDQLPNL